MNKFTTGKALLGLMIIMLLQSCGSKEKYTFEYKLKEGDTFKQNSVMDIQTTQNMMGQEMKISSVINAKANFVVTGAEANQYTLDMQYENMKMDLDMGVTQFTLDSNTSEDVTTPTNMSPMFKAMMGKPIHISIDKLGNVERVEGFNKLIEDMFATIDSNMDEAARQQLMEAGKQQFSEDAVKELFKMSFLYSNGKEVAIGESWEISKDAMSNGISLAVNSKMTLKSVKDNIATIKVDGTLGTPAEGVTQSLQGFEAKIQMQGTQEGEMMVDINTGLLTNMDMTQKITGELEMMGMKLPQDIVTKITVTDK